MKKNIDPRKVRGFKTTSERLAKWGLQMTVPLSDYQNAEERQGIRCLKCNRVWPKKRPDKCGPNGFMCICQRVRDRKTLEETHPRLAAEWDVEFNQPLLVDEVTKGSDKVVRWNGQCGHSWTSSISNRVKGQGCPFCSGAAVLPGFNDLQSNHPDLAMEIDEEEMGKDFGIRVSAGSHQIASWICGEGHRWEAIVKNRALQGKGCPYCSNMRVLKGWNDLLSNFPKLAEQVEGQNAEEIYFASTKRISWVCPEGHSSYQATPKQRVQLGTGCPACSGRVAVTGQSDAGTVFPQSSQFFDHEKNTKPLDQLLPTSGGVFWWRCSSGHEYQAPLANMLRSDKCWACEGKILVIGENDLESKSPEVAATWDYGKNYPRNPREVRYGSTKLFWWKCLEGHSWRASPNTRSKSGCRGCSEFGFNPRKPSLLYFVENAEIGVGKVGITNVGTDRLQYWRNNGWIEKHLVRRDNGQLIWELEHIFFRILREELGVAVALSKEQMERRGGASETFFSDAIKTREVISILDNNLLKLDRRYSR